MDTNTLAIITGIIGMITGTVALGWDVYKWYYAERVFLEVWAKPNYKITTDPYDRDYICVKVVNKGKITTTIKMLSMHGFNKKPSKKTINGEACAIMLNPAFGELPVKLEPGDDWTGGFTQGPENLDMFEDYKYFYIQVHENLSDFPFRAEVDRSLIK